MKQFKKDKKPEKDLPSNKIMKQMVKEWLKDKKKGKRKSTNKDPLRNLSNQLTLQIKE